jgi:hypothetical protein
MRVGQRKYRQEGEGRPAASTTTAANPDPIVMLVVRLFAAPPVANNRILFTDRAPA